MRRPAAALLAVLAAACDSGTGPTPTVLTLTGPSSVTGETFTIGGSPVLICVYELTASVTGPFGETAEFLGASVRLDPARPGLPPTNEYDAEQVASWFNVRSIAAGASATGWASESHSAPFTAEFRLAYMPSRGSPGMVTHVVQCRAP